MTRRLTRAEALARLTGGRVPVMDRDNYNMLAIAHHQQRLSILSGGPSEAEFWDWVGGCLFFYRIAQLLGRRVSEMMALRELALEMIPGHAQSCAMTYEQRERVRASTVIMDELLAIASGEVCMQAIAKARAELDALQIDYHTTHKVKT